MRPSCWATHGATRNLVKCEVRCHSTFLPWCTMNILSVWLSQCRCSSGQSHSTLISCRCTSRLYCNRIWHMFLKVYPVSFSEKWLWGWATSWIRCCSTAKNMMLTQSERSMVAKRLSADSTVIAWDSLASPILGMLGCAAFASTNTGELLLEALQMIPLTCCDCQW